MSKASTRWMDQAQYDLDTAHAMFESGRYLYVLFCCQQAVEKTLKALISQRTKELPPRIHQLKRLAETAKLEISEAQAELLRELSSYYIQSRYPEEISDIALNVNRQETRGILAQTQEMIEWIKSMI